MGANWKTTVCGIALAMIPAIEGYQGHDWKGYVSAALIAAFGFLAKDFNVTGGTQPASPNAMASKSN